MALTVSGISKRIRDKWVLRDISFETERGGVTGIFGLTGSGKTTLLRIIAGDESSNGGSVTCKTKVTLFPSANSGGFTSLFTSKDSTISISALREAIEGADGVLLLDDVFSDLDDRECDEAAHLVRRAAERGACMVVTSSRYDDIMRVCDKAVVLNHSYVRQQGSPKEIYEEPVTVDVAALVGRCNMIEARRLTSTKKEAPEFQTIHGSHRLFARRTEKRELGAINQNVHLAIRPEQIALSFGASFPEDNLLKAVITGIRFFGCVTYVDLDANGLKLEALIPKAVGLNVGDECLVALPPDRLIVLKA